MPNKKKRGLIPTYFSHSYRSVDRDLNLFFWQLFWDSGFLFTVDPKSDVLSIPYLEYLMRRSACFAAVIPCRPRQLPERCSPFAIWEYGLATQAQKPRLAFVEATVNSRFFPPGLPGVCVFMKDRLEEQRDQFVTEINRLHRESLAYSTIDIRLRGKVGIILPVDKGTGAHYTNELLHRLHELLSERGYTPELVPLKFNSSLEFNLKLDEFDFTIIDVGSSEFHPWIYPLLHGRFIPSIKLLHLPLSSADAQLHPLIASQLLKTGMGDSDTVVFWRELDDLLELVNRQLDKFDTKRVEFRSFEDGNRYFRNLGLNEARVFVSNARAANDVASKLSRELSARGINHFHYIESNTIPLGSDWEFHLRKTLEDTDIFILLVTRDYEQSEYCTFEKKIASEHLESGSIMVIPYFLEPPDLNYPSQGRDLTNLDESAQVERILTDVDQLLTSEEQECISVQARAGGPTEDEQPIDVAIITVLQDEYKAVLNRLKNTRRPTPQQDTPDTCAWMLGEISSPAYERPFRVVVAMTTRAGNISGSQVTRSTIERWEPRYAVLAGVGGGLPREKLEKGDVVVSSTIWGYEYGKVLETFDPRPDYTYQVDSGLLRNASALAIRDPSWGIGLTHPEQGNELRPKVVVGPVASGDKVIDDARSDFFRQVLNKWPKLQAVEMEGAGAAAAIAEVQSLGHAVGFIMVKGISDMPPMEESIGAGIDDGQERTEERDCWKEVAAEASAAFTIHFIRNGWPLPPRRLRN